MHAQRLIPITSNGKDLLRINRFNFIVFDFASDEAIAFDATNAPSKVNSISPARNRPPQNVDVLVSIGARTKKDGNETLKYPGRQERRRSAEACLLQD